MTDIGTLELEFVAHREQFAAQMTALRRDVENTFKDFDKRTRQSGGGFDYIQKGAKKAGTAINSLQGQTSNMAAQFSDFFIQVQGGGSVMTAALQQGAQLGAVLSGAGGVGGAVKGVGAAFASLLSPVNLATIGLLAAGGAAAKYLMNREDADAMAEALKKHPEIINAIRDAWGEAAAKAADYSFRSGSAVEASIEQQKRALSKGIEDVTKKTSDLASPLQFIPTSTNTAFSEALSNIASNTEKLTGAAAKAAPNGLDKIKQAIAELNKEAGDPTAIFRFVDAVSQVSVAKDTATDVRDLADSMLAAIEPARKAAEQILGYQTAQKLAADSTTKLMMETQQFNTLMSQGMYQQAAEHAQTLGQALTAAAAAQKALNAETNRFASERLANAGQGYEALNDYYSRKAAGISGEAYSPSSGILDLIAQSEGTKNRRGYNETLDYGRWTGGDRNLTQMTLDQIDALQTKMLANPENRALYGNGKGSSAVGQYMTTRETLRDFRSQLGLKGSDFFTPEVQDRIAQEMVRQTGGDVSKLQGRWEGLKKVDSSVISTAMGNSSLTMPGRDQVQEQRLKTYQDLMKSGELYIAEQQREATAVTQTSEVTGLASEQSRKLAYEQEMLNRILALGVQVTPQQAQAISQLASRMAEAETATARLATSQSDLRSAQQEVKDSNRDALKGFISDLIKGRDASDALSDALSKVGDTMLNIGLNYLLTGSASGQGSGGFLGSLFKVLGFADGGYTGAGGKYQPAGVVHAGEYVFDANATKRIGVGNLEAMRRAAQMPGYADGGFVSTSFPSPSTFMGKSQPTNVVVRVDNDGNLQAFVERTSGAHVRAAAPQIVSTSVKMAGARVVPTMAAYQANRAGGDYRNG